MIIEVITANHYLIEAPRCSDAQKPPDSLFYIGSVYSHINFKLLGAYNIISLVQIMTVA